MTKELKIYKELTSIETFDWIIYTTASPEAIDKIVNSNKFVVIWNDRIAVHQIKRYWPKKLDSIESYILSQPQDIQEILKKRQNEKINRVWRWFDSIEEITKYLNSRK